MITAAKEVIQAPERGTYKWQMFTQWADEFRTTHADHVAYIALHMAGVLDPCRQKLDALMQRHTSQLSAGASARHRRAIERLQNTMTGAAMAYAARFHRPH